MSFRYLGFHFSIYFSGFYFSTYIYIYIYTNGDLIHMLLVMHSIEVIYSGFLCEIIYV